MDKEQLRALAKALVAKTEKLYAPGDRCPMCGYDAYWDYGSIEESEEAVFEALAEAAGIDGYGEVGDERGGKQDQGSGE